MRPSRFLMMMLAVLAIPLLLVGASPAQTVTTVYSFNGADGDDPNFVVPVQGRDGNLYGTTATSAATAGDGTAWQLSTSGELKVLHTFTIESGNWSVSGLTQASDGNFYGTTQQGGSSSQGVLFKLTKDGGYLVLHSFSGGADGQIGYAPPIEASDGNLYGATYGGNNGKSRSSTVYKYTPAGAFSTIHFFTNLEAANIESPVIQGADGNLYGTSMAGGNGSGTIFKMNLAGQVLQIFDFGTSSELGYSPSALLQANDGSFYGSTLGGGTYNQGTIFRMNQLGRVTTLYNFGATPTDGQQPSAMVQGTDSNLYGVTTKGGASGMGTIFQLTTAGAYKQVSSFGFADCIVPPLQHTNGTFYGVSPRGGTYDYGYSYAFDIGLGPFVTFVRTMGKIGQTAQFLGQGLTGSTGVTFNGVAASSFKVQSDTFMTAVVPSGATTGKVVVTTPSGALTSNVNFRIIQ
jgi:uncharacterized repeat protein (TIGR03803 family)